MQKILMVLVLILSLATVNIVIAISGSYSQDELNTTNTEQNITYDTSPFSEIVWITIPRKINITDAEWNLTGLILNTDYNTHSGYVIENGSSVLCEGTWEGVRPCSYAYDNNWGTWAACSTDDCYFYMNYTKPVNAYNATWHMMASSGAPSNELLYELPTDCFNQTPIQLRAHSDKVVPIGTTWHCHNLTSWDLIYDGYSVGSITIYEEELWFNVTYPENITMDTGDDNSNDYINDTEFNTTQTIDLNVTAINDYLQDTCSADWSTGDCDVPFNISSLAPGIIEISSITISGEYYDTVGNCSDDIFVSSLNFTFHDEHTLADIDGSAEYIVEILDDCCDFTYNSSITNLSEFSICILPGSYNIDMMMLYRSSGYEQRTYYFYNASISDTTQTIPLYQITNALGEKIEANTRDNNDNDIGQVYVSIARYYPETDSYRTVAIGRSDNTGKFITYLDLDDVFYQFTLSQAGEAVNLYSAMTITDTDDDPETMILYIGALETQFFEMIDDIGVSCYFNDTSNNTICTITDPTGLITSATLHVQEIGLSGVTSICTDTGSGTSFTLSCNIPAPDGEYRYYVEMTPEPNPSYIIYTDFIYTSTTNVYGISGLFIALLLTLAVAGIGIYVHEILGIVLGVVWGAITMSGIITLPGVAITSIIIMGVLLLIGNMRRG